MIDWSVFSTCIKWGWSVYRYLYLYPVDDVWCCPLLFFVLVCRETVKRTNATIIYYNRDVDVFTYTRVCSHCKGVQHTFYNS